ncbi:hypothetical protein [Psychrosphaera haliotis]|uniref:DUF560 domain-containing protein n=1 Tax=Psychrosphaera haliotis TaxID=555083 RepID=A0A6N8FAG0_9GAMM|nr:hypothetical protein [Psychrosphaera haliotis]MUH71752.1 hypothetical protein [Psychrosphaera haliotis]
MVTFGVFGDWDKTYDLHGTMLEEESEIYVNAEGPRQLYAEAGALKRTSFWNGTYYDITSFSGFSRFDPWQNVRIWAFLRTGDQIDYSNDRLGEGINAEIGTNFKVGRHVNGEVNVNYRDLDVNGGTLFEAYQYDLRLNYQFNLLSYIRFIVQYTDIERNTELYNKPVDSMFRGLRTELLYAYKLNPQSLLYVGYTDRGKRDDSLDEFQKDNRKVFLKLSYAFQI